MNEGKNADERNGAAKPAMLNAFSVVMDIKVPRLAVRRTVHALRPVDCSLLRRDALAGRAAAHASASKLPPGARVPQVEPRTLSVFGSVATRPPILVVRARRRLVR